MTPIKHPLCNDVLRAPAGDTNCNDLHVMRGEDAFMLGAGQSVNSFWRPSKEELQAINDGHPIVLHARGITHPPVSLLVLDQPYAVPVMADDDEIDKLKQLASDWKAEADRWRRIAMGHEQHPSQLN